MKKTGFSEFNANRVHNRIQVQASDLIQANFNIWNTSLLSCLKFLPSSGIWKQIILLSPRNKLSVSSHSRRTIKSIGIFAAPKRALSLLTKLICYLSQPASVWHLPGSIRSMPTLSRLCSDSFLAITANMTSQVHTSGTACKPRLSWSLIQY